MCVYVCSNSLVWVPFDFYFLVTNDIDDDDNEFFVSFHFILFMVKWIHRTRIYLINNYYFFTDCTSLNPVFFLLFFYFVTCPVFLVGFLSIYLSIGHIVNFVGLLLNSMIITGIMATNLTNNNNNDDKKERRTYPIW